ncbi:site-specific integrase [Gorillibacterium timonense]|uniref:site-specific integrase n=1 Tax=Gorillibacterium timonense TaxID=1689269 RepID=UPI00071DBC96|nr:site-specific integrase [Gorillibacterium timonense]
MKGSYRQRGCKCPPEHKKCTCGALWEFRIDLGKDPLTGKRLTKEKGGFETEKAARQAAAAFWTDYQRGMAATRGDRKTVAGFMKEFLEVTLVNEIGSTTYENKLAIMENHIVPQIGNLKLQKVTHADLQRFVNTLVAEGLNPGTIRNIMRLVNQTLRHAVVTGVIFTNPAAHVKKPGYKQKTHNVWTKEEWTKFLTSSAKSRLYPFYLIALNTGMRPGEILALDWDHVDLKRRVIRVDRTVVYTKSKGIEIKPSPKTDSSNRSITIPESVAAYLKRLKLGQKLSRLNLIIPGQRSDIVYNSALNKGMKNDIEAAGVPYITPHELRHTHATFLLSPKPFGLGIGIKAVSERLGHASTTVTLNTYAHVLENMQDAIAEALEETQTITNM